VTPNIDLHSDKLRGETGEPIVAAVGESRLNNQILALDVGVLAETLPQGGGIRSEVGKRL